MRYMLRQVSLRTTLVLFVALAILFALLRDPAVRIGRASLVSWELIETKQDLDNALASQTAFVFVHHGGSTNSIAAKHRVEDFVVGWRWKNREPDISFFLIDHTETLPPWLIEWGRSDDKLTLIQSGYGQSILLQRGEVLHRLEGYQNTVGNLREKTTVVLNEN